MKIRVVLMGLVACAFAAAPVSASDVGYIYGRVETTDGDQYVGQLRWGDEEAFWDDMFNASKTENENIDYLDDDDRRRLERREWRGWGFFSDRDEEFTHLFAVRFGDMKRITVKRGDRLMVEFRNGKTIDLEGGSNDVGARITVADPKIGEMELRWNRIRTIEFMDTPEKLAGKLGEPLYGTVESAEGKFTGLIQWDHDEALSIDKLNGRTQDGRVALEMGNIASIRKHRRGAMVTLVSGLELYLTGTNDVDRDNRGIVVKVPDMGRVKIGWDDFEEITFHHPVPTSGSAYAAYASVSELKGAVVTRSGRRHSGRIVYDLDESWDFEMLHGMSGDSEYMIPFRNIASIRPVGTRRAEVKLRNGQTIELGKGQDVSRDNSGLLVFGDSRNPTYVAWRDLEEVVFQ